MKGEGVPFPRAPHAELSCGIVVITCHTQQQILTFTHDYYPGMREKERCSSIEGVQEGPSMQSHYYYFLNSSRQNGT